MGRAGHAVISGKLAFAVWLRNDGTYCISKLCLIHMLLLQELCATLLDQVRGVQVHLALLFEIDQFLFQLGIPLQSENIVYNCISMLLQPLANSWRYGCLKAFQRYSAH